MKKLKTNESTSIEVHQMEPLWNTIIINQLPLRIDESKLISIFSQYGIIENMYLCREMYPFEHPKHERIARIVFRNEESAWWVWADSEKKLIKYDDHVLTITVVSDDYSPIQNLPDTCLREILDRVGSVKDKFHVEMVCKRWKANGRSTWSNFTEVECNYFGINTWRVILNRVRTLESAHLCLKPGDEEQVLAAVTEHCTNLKKLSITFIEQHGFPMNYGECIPRLGRLIEQNKNLLRIRFNTYTHLEDNVVINFLKLLPAGLVELHLKVKGQTIPPAMILSKFKKLRVLKLRGVIIKDQQLTDDVVTSVERLFLASCKIPPSVFSQILKNNKGLKYLDIATRFMSDETFAHVRQLENLQVLGLAVDIFNDLNLGGMTPTLRGLAYGSYNVTEQGVQRFFDSASNIKKLLLSCRSSPFNFISIARRWMERTGKFLELSFRSNLFDEYPELEGQSTDQLKIVKSEMGRFPVDGHDWGSELIQ